MVAIVSVFSRRMEFFFSKFALRMVGRQALRIPIAGSVEVQTTTSCIPQVTSKPLTLEAVTMRAIEEAQTLFVPCQNSRYTMKDICTHKKPSKKIPVKVTFWVLFV